MTFVGRRGLSATLHIHKVLGKKREGASLQAGLPFCLGDTQGHSGAPRSIRILHV